MSQTPPFPPKMVVCVGAVVLKEAKVLFIRQTYGVYKGRWSIPWGFCCDDDGVPEPPQVAALREVKEEAGITAVSPTLLGIQNDSQSTNGRDEAWLYILFQCQHHTGTPTPDGVETDAAAYLTLNEIDNFDEEIEPFSKWLTRRVLQSVTHPISKLNKTPFPPHHAFL